MFLAQNFRYFDIRGALRSVIIVLGLAHLNGYSVYRGLDSLYIIQLNFISL